MFKSVYIVLLEIQKKYPHITYTEYFQGDRKVFEFKLNEKFVKLYTNLTTGEILYITKNKTHSKDPLSGDEIYLFKDNVENILL
jgi:hypothetical protein